MEILAWIIEVLWRVLQTLGLLVGCIFAIVVAFQMARILRPRNIVKAWNGDIPVLKAIQVLGNRVELEQVSLDRDSQLCILQKQVEEITKQIEGILELLGEEDDDEPWKK